MTSVSQGTNATIRPLQNGCERLLDSKQAAQILGVNPKLLQRLARERGLPAIRVGKLWRFRASDINAWIEREINHHK
jgi:excisionase family DNA binding protein